MVIESKVKLTADQQRAMALVREGKRHTLFYGGSRCISGDSHIDGYAETIAELAKIGKAIIVKTPFGPRIAKAPWLKGADYLLRITLDSGKQIKVTADHKFYDGKQWIQASSLSVGAFVSVNKSDPIHQQSTWAFFLLVNLLDALHLIHKPQDWQDIVINIPIDMMNDFIRKQSAPQFIMHPHPMKWRIAVRIITSIRPNQISIFRINRNPKQYIALAIKSPSHNLRPHLR